MELQKRRVGLVHKHQAYKAAMDRYLDRLMESYRKATEIEGKIAIIDVALNELMDKSIQRLENEYADEG